MLIKPPIHDSRSPDSLNLTLAQWYAMIIGKEEKNTSREALADSNSWVDVRDTALAHVLALQKEEAGGERFIISGGRFTWQDWGKRFRALILNVFLTRVLSFCSRRRTQSRSETFRR